MRSLFGRAPKEKPTATLFYASDVHGAEPCWRKFLGAARFYDTEYLVMGGDVAGKAVVPIERDGDAFSTTFLGEHQTGEGEAALEELLQAIRFQGMYPWQASREEIEHHRTDSAARALLLDRVINDELKLWLDLADERMAERGVGVFVMAGNDDPWSCDETIAAASWVTACDARVVHLGPHEMISSSYANTTPWNSARELDEEALYKHLKGLAEMVEDPSRAIFNLHVPPFDSGLDTAAELKDDFSVVFEGGSPKEIPVGSTAVRQIIEEYQPLLSLHGHIHESRGETYIGRTLAINTGSEYQTGVLHGGLIKLNGSEVTHHQLISG
ncbi:MAG: metallophosphoesterase [Actinobacteria bacterium]|nr:metallophosphoesterase [Actinomycetota bacterium]